MVGFVLKTDVASMNTAGHTGSLPADISSLNFRLHFKAKSKNTFDDTGMDPTHGVAVYFQSGS